MFYINNVCLESYNLNHTKMSSKLTFNLSKIKIGNTDIKVDEFYLLYV